jgi:hypothetical protein
MTIFFTTTNRRADSFHQKDSRDTASLKDLMRSLFSQRSSTSEAVTAGQSHGSSEVRQPSQVSVHLETFDV